jgi:hypothetical protein
VSILHIINHSVYIAYHQDTIFRAYTLQPDVLVWIPIKLTLFPPPIIFIILFIMKIQLHSQCTTCSICVDTGSCMHEANLSGSFIKNFISIKYHATSANLLTWQDHCEEREEGVSWDTRGVSSPYMLDQCILDSSWSARWNQRYWIICKRENCLEWNTMQTTIWKKELSNLHIYGTIYMVIFTYMISLSTLLFIMVPYKLKILYITV